MNVRRTETAAPAVAPAVALPSSQSAAPAAAARAQADSSFASTSAPAADRLGTSRSGPHVALPSMASLVPPARVVGPLELTSPDARQAVDSSMNYLNLRIGETLRGDAHDEFSVRSVERDELGMTHVRMDRVHDGLKVYPEQVITHLDKDGNVTGLTGQVQPIPETLAAARPSLDSDAALKTAMKEFGKSTDRQPSVEKVITQDQDGSYRVAYHVECTNLGLSSGPQRQNYLVDAETGRVIK
ncbi:MAG TPA: hypothetical protein VND93_27175, partial [Myxococcales bacterium]|nr:hypothetical protein [Myxococcales bacterium]